MTDSFDLPAVVHCTGCGCVWEARSCCLQELAPRWRAAACRGLGYRPQKPAGQRWKSKISKISPNTNHSTYKKNIWMFILAFTWYVNTPWCDVLINKVFSTFPTTRARNTTSNDVFPPGGIICIRTRLKIEKEGNWHNKWHGNKHFLTEYSLQQSFTCTDPLPAGLITWKSWKLTLTTPDLKVHCYENITATL